MRIQSTAHAAAASRLARWPRNTLIGIGIVLASVHAFATDILGVQQAALDQPTINALLRLPDGTLLNGIDAIGDPTFTVQAFFDTGASGVILSDQTATAFSVPRAPGVTFHDVGIGGSTQFQVSQPLLVDLAPFTPLVDLSDPASYNQRFGPLRAQVGPLTVSNPLLADADVFGIPTMQGKVVVMDPKPLNTFDPSDPFSLARMQTYVYDPGTPFKPGTANSDPGIPHTARTVKLSFANFSGFTEVTPSGAQGPTLAANPFVGPNPLANPNAPPDTTPGVTLRLGNKQTTGSFLLDTGAAASIISTAQAAKLGVRYRAGSAQPELETFDPAHPELPGTLLAKQFVLPLSGIGGDENVAGFFLSSMLVRTQQGSAANDNDPAHLRFLDVPVLVTDITLTDPSNKKVITLDGVLAMNLLLASVTLSFDLSDPSNPNISVDGFRQAPFDWVVFDPQQGVLGLDVSAVPEPATYLSALLGLSLLGWRLRRARIR